MKGVHATLRRFGRGLYVFSSIIIAIIGLPYALLAGSGLSVLFLAAMTVGTIFQRN